MQAAAMIEVKQVLINGEFANTVSYPLHHLLQN